MKYWGLDEAKNIGAAFFAAANTDSARPVYAQAQYDGHLESKEHRRWVTSTYADVKPKVCKIAKYLKTLGVKKGSKVAILSTSRPEWMEADIAIVSLGGITISIYQTLPEAEVAYILFDSGADIVFAENEEQAKKLINIHGREWDIPGTEDRPAQKAKILIKKIITFEDSFPDSLMIDYRDLIKGPECEVPNEIKELSRQDLASFVYTSGTTGPPKGVVQTHGNHLSNVRQAAESGLFSDDSTIMLFLPLAHSFAKLMGYIGFLTPASLKFIAIIDTKTSRMEPVSVTRDIREGSANIVPIVPRLLEKMRDGIVRQAASKGLKGVILGATINSALAVYDKRASVGAHLLYLLTTGIRKKICLTLFGPHFKYCISGGAKLPVAVARFFDAIGVEVLEGYGLTETCVATNVNRYGNKKIGTVGPLLSKDIEIKILEDGEIAYRGPNISLGYHNRKAATAASWDNEGWFKTGDLGSIDNDGFLTITGRKKELIVSSNGKKIAPQDIEDKLKNSPYVSQVVLCGEGKPYCTALVTINEESIKMHFQNGNKPVPQKLSEDPAVKDLIWSHIDKVNGGLANFEQVRKISILPVDFTLDNGLLTPTFKVKRKLVENKYRELIEGMY